MQIINLSIAIPTYNGAVTIRDTIDSIICQLQPNVEVIVSDNASTDNIKAIVDEYCANNVPIRYERNDCNVGIMKNFDLCVERAKGEYVWIFGDDDQMSLGCIDKILSIINNKEKPGFISVSADIYGQGWVLKKHNPLGLDHDVFFKNASDAFCVLKDHIGLTPTIVVRKSSWLSQHQIRRSTDNYWFHVRMVLAIAQNEPSCFVARPPVMFNQGNVRWTKNGLFLNIICEFCELVLQLDESFDVRCKKESIDRWYKTLWVQVLGAKNNGWTWNFSIIMRLVALFKSRPSFWIIIVPLLLLPGSVIKVLYYIRAWARNSIKTSSNL